VIALPPLLAGAVQLTRMPLLVAGLATGAAGCPGTVAADCGVRAKFCVVVAPFVTDTLAGEDVAKPLAEAVTE